jgi:predicted ester cyclase
MNKLTRGAYGASDDIVDYILGITYEIWEQGGVELIEQYYARDIPVYTLEGVSRGSQSVIDGTRAMLAAFPDRLLLADDVIWSGDRQSGYLSSHRILSPMTNTGDTIYGPATGRRVRIMNIADCFVEDGVITREWLMRDNLALVTQLGFDPLAAAAAAASRRDAFSVDWIASEVSRLEGQGLGDVAAGSTAPAALPQDFARQVITGLWSAADPQAPRSAYAPYAVLHRSPVSLCSGRDALLGHYASLRAAFDVVGLSIDHVATRPRSAVDVDMAVRWTLAARHRGDYLGLAATGRTAFILGATHWRIIDGRIAIEWTVFDQVGVLSQLV